LHNQHEFSGTGIGLAISKKNIENLVGRIGLESEPEKRQPFILPLKNKLLKFVEGAYIVYKPLSSL
jgi:light-regulated signal transduction histidine kinase (bacteriophytochrome)